MDEKTIIFDGETDYLKTKAFKLQSDFGTLTCLPGVSGNYFPVKPMKNKNSKKKNNTQNVRALLKTIKSLERMIDGERTIRFQQNNELSTLYREKEKLERELQGLRTTHSGLTANYHEKLRFVGLYFAAIDAETPSTEDSKQYLRGLRHQIFQ